MDSALRRHLRNFSTDLRTSSSELQRHDDGAAAKSAASATLESSPIVQQLSLRGGAGRRRGRSVSNLLAAPLENVAEGTLVDRQWIGSDSGRRFVNVITRGLTPDPVCGILEDPNVPSEWDAVTSVRDVKIAVSGKAAAGKTSTIANLCGLEVPSTHVETTGIQLSGTIWPVKRASGSVVIFKLRFSQAGAALLAEYHGAAEALFSEKHDALFLVASMTDPDAFLDLRREIQEAKAGLVFVIATKSDLIDDLRISRASLAAVSEEFCVPIYFLQNLGSDLGSEAFLANEVEVSKIKNDLAELLLRPADERRRHVRIFREAGGGEPLKVARHLSPLDSVVLRSPAASQASAPSSGVFQLQSRLAISRIIGGRSSALRESTSDLARPTSGLSESCAPSPSAKVGDGLLVRPKYQSFDDLPSAAQERRRAAEFEVPSKGSSDTASSCPATPERSNSRRPSEADLTGSISSVDAMLVSADDARPQGGSGTLERASSDASLEKHHKPKLISDESQESFALVYAMLRGIHDAVVESYAKRATREEQLYKDLAIPQIVLLPQDFASAYRFNYTSDRVQDEDQPSSSKSERNLYSFRFVDFAPFIFINIRGAFSFDTAAYLDSLTQQLELYEIKSPGKSPSFFYFSHDFQFLLKTINQEETTLFRNILPKFYQFVVHNPDTLLCKFFGLHAVQLHAGPTHHFVVMESAFPPEFVIHEKYDLKGSTVGRNASEEEKQDDHVILKDLDVRRVFRLGADARAELMAQLERDTKFLEEQQVLDYSFLIGVHRLGPTSPDINTISNHTVFYESADGTEYFWFLIIDIFQEWNLRKRLENSIKSLWSDGTQISAVHPTMYRERFMKFLNGIIVE